MLAKSQTTIVWDLSGFCQQVYVGVVVKFFVLRGLSFSAGFLFAVLVRVLFLRYFFLGDSGFLENFSGSRSLEGFFSASGRVLGIFFSADKQHIAILGTNVLR
ncbi:hypothetical protein F8M41_019489 [Gigaspora margarita]|uniref:Uncharacterized protein n=1 Tax=Gigaspora margarita TaxID=4874 RepID=A0A8H4AJW5_GIGMA|nr:hypothetical protein F8M41_019489 [Gigaspora margarita]